MTQAGNDTYSYDERGNLVERVRDGETTRYVWDDQNRLVAVEYPDDASTRFFYDAFGRRIGKIDRHLRLIRRHHGANAAGIDLRVRGEGTTSRVAVLGQERLDFLGIQSTTDIIQRDEVMPSDEGGVERLFERAHTGVLLGDCLDLRSIDSGRDPVAIALASLGLIGFAHVDWRPARQPSA